MLGTLRERLPEAVPTRWDIYDTYRHTLVDEGFETLVNFVDANRDELLSLRVKTPARDVTLEGLAGWGLDQREGCLRASHLRIELNARILEGRKSPERLMAAFEALSKAVKPFYAEARILEGLPIRADQLAGPGAPVYPVNGNRWWACPEPHRSRRSWDTRMRRYGRHWATTDASALRSAGPPR